jgi:hypothetical protein
LRDHTQLSEVSCMYPARCADLDCRSESSVTSPEVWAFPRENVDCLATVLIACPSYIVSVCELYLCRYECFWIEISLATMNISREKYVGRNLFSFGLTASTAKTYFPLEGQ